MTVSEDEIIQKLNAQNLRGNEQRLVLIEDGLAKVIKRSTTSAWLYWPEGYTERWPNFRPHEFRSGCGSRYLQLDTRLLDGLERMRAALGGHPMVINSGYRSKSWNAAKRGEENSQHLHGRAADIWVSEPVKNMRLFEQAAKDWAPFREGGIGVYPGRSFIHVDCRLNGPARWSEKAKFQPR